MTDKCKTLYIESGSYKTETTDKFENRKPWKKPCENEIHSYIPGTVIHLFAEEGERLKKGDCIMILEAMKMQNKVLMPADGVVKSINVTENQKVPKGYLMILIES